MKTVEEIYQEMAAAFAEETGAEDALSCPLEVKSTTPWPQEAIVAAQSTAAAAASHFFFIWNPILSPRRRANPFFL